MSSERLEPFEELEKDYYLGGRSGWYSDGEQRDSESSDDELREELSKLAGVRCESRKKTQEKKASKKKDEFESDMDDELDESFVAHASKMFSTPNKGTSKLSDDKALSTDDEIPALVGDTDDEMEAGSSNMTAMQKETALENDNDSTERSTDSTNRPKKSVTFAKNDDQTKGHDKNEGSAFDDEDNLLRKAVNKAAKATKKEAAEFYDSDEDEDNERWVRQHREQLKILKPRPNSSIKSDSKEDFGSRGHKEQDGETDAVLSCPACMSLLTRDCQRHDLYRDQYRAIFVENCSVVMNEVLFLPQSGKNNRKARKNAAGIKPNTSIDPADVASLPKEDLFHPVRCSVCSTNVAVYDSEEVFHFFNVLSGYA